MSAYSNANDAAFGHSAQYPNGEMVHAPGLTKREYIATQALAGMVADPSRNGTHESFAVDAVKFADALLAELAKGAAQ